MCDPECRERFRSIEIEVAQIGTDIKWIKKLATVTAIVLASILGFDLSGIAGV